MNTNDYNLKLYEPSFEAFSSDKDSSKQVAVMMSGGVDSSVTAYLLQQQGFDVVGVTMRIPVACGVNSRGCCGADAAYVCNQLKMPHYFVDVTEAFNTLVIDAFRDAYSAGRTPNPCVDCNSILKFSLFWDFISEKLGVINFATGHYAQVIRTDKGARLCRAVNKAKDQSYFIYGIPAAKVEHLYLPLGGLTKPQVREIASQIDLGVAEKAESMELCFAGEGDYRDALNLDQADKPGDMLDMQGNIIGTHKGVANYTLGQRRGLGFAAGEPVYVGKMDPKNNTVSLGIREEVTESRISAKDANILVPDEFKKANKLNGKIRSGGDPRQCTITEVTKDGFSVEFNEPQFAPCPGQRIVLYNDQDQVIAGGVII
jgi:tRNA-uridine 2-sulfurtransferase